MQKKLIFPLIFGVVLSLLIAQEAEEKRPDDLKNSAIVVKNVTNFFDDTQPLVASFEPRYIHTVAWSPDGKFLLIDRNFPSLGHSLEKIPFPYTGEIIHLTPRRDGKNRLNFSNPTWTPDGKGIVFVGQNHENPTATKDSLPPYALASNLCYITASGKNMQQLTRIRSSYSVLNGGVSPRFSPDGKKLFWTKSTQSKNSTSLWGERELCIGNFTIKEDGTPALTKIRSFTPAKGSTAYYESYGFSPDGTKILYCSNLNLDQQWVTADIVSQDFNPETNLPEGEPVVLTKFPDVWDRYATWSPNGKKIIWSSSAGFLISFLGLGGAQWQQAMRSELWVMNSDGSDCQRLTSFNYKNTPFYMGGACYVGMSAWHPDGKHLAVLVHKAYKLTEVSTALLLIELGDAYSTPAPPKQ